MDMEIHNIDQKWYNVLYKNGYITIYENNFHVYVKNCKTLHKYEDYKKMYSDKIEKKWISNDLKKAYIEMNKNLFDFMKSYERNKKIDSLLNDDPFETLIKAC